MATTQPEETLCHSPSDIQRDSSSEELTAMQSSNVDLKSQWEKHMKDLDPQRRYRKVAVLMLHWEKMAYNFVDAQDEVNRLRKVFETRYNFTVVEKKLKTMKTPRDRSPPVQIQKYLVDLVYDHDGPETLLIIYYAGHGTPHPATGQLVFSGGNLPEMNDQSINHIVWHEAESLLHKAHQADMFLILDCCHAGKLPAMHRRDSWSKRIFEFLGATGPDGTTRLPGPESFSSALIWALETLAEEHNGFTTSELLTKIREAPKFPRDKQLPHLSERDLHCVRRLILEPLPKGGHQPRSDSFQNAESPANFEYYLDLKLLLPKKPNEQELETMCSGLKQLIRNKELLASQILWRGLHAKEHFGNELSRIVREVFLTQKIKRLQKELMAGGASAPAAPVPALQIPPSPASSSPSSQRKRARDVSDEVEESESPSSHAEANRQRRSLPRKSKARLR